MADEPLVSAEEMESVLSTDDTPEVLADAEENSGRYSLRRPVTIAAEAEAAARQRVEEIASTLAATMSEEMEMTIEIQVTGFQQQQVSNAIDSLAKPAWAMSFAGTDGGGLACVLDPVCALTLVEVALGGLVNAPGEPREPTPLESGILKNLAKTILPTMASRTKMPFSASHFTVGQIPEIVATGGEMVGAAIVSIRFDESERSGLLLLTANMLREGDASFSDQPLQPGPLAQRLLPVHLEARPVLCAGVISLSDLHDLEPGRVLQLEAPVDRLLELRIAEEAVFRGRIMRTDEGAQFGIDWRRGIFGDDQTTANREETT